MKFRKYKLYLHHQYLVLTTPSNTHTLSSCAYILAWTCRQQPWQYSRGEVPSSCSRGLVGVGGQFCSLKEKQISGTRGLVLLRPPQGGVGPSIGDDLKVSLASMGVLSSALSSCWKIIHFSCDLHRHYLPLTIILYFIHRDSLSES